MIKPTLKWKHRTEVRTLKSGASVEGPTASIALLEGLRDDVIPGGALSGCHRAAAAGEQYMKANAPWTDRTGTARRGLYGAAAQSGDQFAVVFSYGPDIDYGFWLENRFNGRFAIVLPTQEVFSNWLPRFVAEDITLELRGQGSKFRHRETGRFA